MKTILWYDKEGKPVEDYVKWVTEKFGGETKEYFEYRRVGNDENEKYLVSTVLLGLDHRFTNDGPPIIFETMVFGKDTKQEYTIAGKKRMSLGDEVLCDRYSTLAEAEEGHRATCLEYLKREPEPLKPLKKAEED